MIFRALWIVLCGALFLHAQVEPPLEGLRQKIQVHPHFYPAIESLNTREAANAFPASFNLVRASTRPHARTGQLSSMVLSAPLQSFAKDEVDARTGFIAFLQEHQAALNIPVAQISDHLRLTRHNDGDLIQIHGPQYYEGLHVRGAFVQAVINHDRLVLLGTRHWGQPRIDTQPQIDLNTAQAIVSQYTNPYIAKDVWDLPELLIIPLDHQGNSYDYRLAWSIKPLFNEDGRYEALIDARNGALLAFQDTAHYIHDPAETSQRGVAATTRTISGGVLPLNNSGASPESIEQVYPMPFADLTVAGQRLFTDSAGNLPYCVDGEALTALQGLYVHINNGCGLIAETSLGDIDLGTHSGESDCEVDEGQSAGNSLAARTAYYEINRMAQIARAHLPNNTWLHEERLMVNVNIEPQCNAFATADSVNFYSALQNCGNSGYFASIIAHEWAHTMDHNDGTSGMSNPSEGIADVFAALRLNTSCIGDGYLANNCSGYGDACSDCTGVRDIDWQARESGTPHDIDWITANCPTSSQLGPCGSNIYCESAVYAEALWDLYTIDLPNLYAMDAQTARELAMRLTFLGSGGVSNWYQCSQGEGGCLSDSGYLNFLAADDDDGDLSNGTPHMQAIYAAFNRHGIACSDLTVQDSGCGSMPTTAPTVLASPAHQAMDLSWDAVTDANAYRIYRGEGVTMCDRAKVLVGETSDTHFHDIELRNGMTYYYVVIPMGPSDSCYGPASSCISATPSANAAFSIRPQFSVAFDEGDGDQFIDNCEAVRLTVGVDNIGNQDFSDVQIVGLQSPSHPDTQLPSLPILISPSMPGSCGTGEVSLTLRPRNLLPGDVFEVAVEIGSNETFPETITLIFEIPFSEQDLATAETHVFDFQTGTQGWTVESGVFERIADPLDETAYYMQSSQGIDESCDRLRSPIMMLTSESTLSFDLFYDIDLAETTTDRASVVLINLLSGEEVAIVPDSEHLYNASGISLGGFCGNGQAGWAGVLEEWVSTHFSAAALGGDALTAVPVQIEIRNATDTFRASQGLAIDNVVVTAVRMLEQDQQVDDGCGPNCLTLTLDRWPSRPVNEYVFCINQDVTR